MEKLRNQKYSFLFCSPFWGIGFLIIREKSFLPPNSDSFVLVNPSWSEPLIIKTDFS